MIQISFVSTCDGSNISNVPLYANLARSEVRGTSPTKSSASNNILMRRGEWQVQLATKYCCVEVKVLIWMFQTGEKHELFCGGVRHGSYRSHTTSSLIPQRHWERIGKTSTSEKSGKVIKDIWGFKSLLSSYGSERLRWMTDSHSGYWHTITAKRLVRWG